MGKKLPGFCVLDGTTIKLIAMLSMLADHVGSVFFPSLVWLRAIGRLAMPLFSFCIAEGFCHTRNKFRYLIQLLVFGLISEVPFDLAFYGSVGFEQQNIMFSFALSVGSLLLFETLPRITGILAVVGLSTVALFLRLDYFLFATITVFLFYILRNTYFVIHRSIGVLFLVLVRSSGISLFAGFSLIPLLLYNGKRGKGLKWLFYSFYPVHLLVIYIIRMLVLN